MVWNYHILNRYAGAKAPKEWNSILIELKKIISDKNINKIEAAAFVIRGSRKARWKLNKNHAEYSSKNDSLDAAKKLTELLLFSNGGPTLTLRLKKILKNSKRKITVCPTCNKKINLSDFDKDGRRDPNAIQMGHKIPLSRKPQSHNGKNVFWAHRNCNFMQGDRTLKEVFIHMAEILRANGYRVTKK